MPRVFLNDKEAAALVVVLESYILRYPESTTAEMLALVPDRISRCIELQGYGKQGTKKAAIHKDSDRQ